MGSERCSTALTQAFTMELKEIRLRSWHWRTATHQSSHFLSKIKDLRAISYGDTVSHCEISELCEVLYLRRGMNFLNMELYARHLTWREKVHMQLKIASFWCLTFSLQCAAAVFPILAVPMLFFCFTFSLKISPPIKKLQNFVSSTSAWSHLYKL